jgi:hypothetical protein
LTIIASDLTFVDRLREDARDERLLEADIYSLPVNPRSAHFFVQLANVLYKEEYVAPGDHTVSHKGGLREGRELKTQK